MHFLCVSLGYHPDVHGGAWRVAAEQATGLAGRGHTVDVVTVNPGGDLPPTEERRGVRIHRFPKATGHFYANWRGENRAAARLIRECLASSGKDALLIQHHAYLEPAIATAPAPVLQVYHGPWAEEYRYAVRARNHGPLRRILDLAIIRLMYRVEHRALKRAGRIVVLSRHFADCLKTWHGTRLKTPHVVPGGVDFELFHPAVDRALTRSAVGIKEKEFLFLAMRRLDPRMGLDLLIDAFAPVARDFPNARLWLTGRGAAEASLRAQSERLGISQAVRFLGFVKESEIPKLLNAADASLMPSLDLEGFGLATAEALACGTPVLGSQAGATPELLEPLSPALLFKARSVESLEKRLREVLLNPSILPSRSTCADYARQRFSWDAQIKAAETAAKELLARQPVGTQPRAIASH